MVHELKESLAMSHAQTMSEYERIFHYTEQAPGRPLTPAQVRRANKKSRKAPHTSSWYKPEYTVEHQQRQEQHA